ncbi:universal stress protein [Hymenobacter edaphi]|uniref:UspA domain-containing protein n=1 Tax=Hymenobacter edaphi TaxID=2211146 RepID=A0A328BSC5_9BACT|nr:universal stress protein [Hymenobacter edaphi]RAK69997.1 hypothetical protein DLM85_03860 [Hymenobacter edaphi]
MSTAPTLPAAPAAAPARSLSLLVFTSFFPESRRALRLAAELARPLGARLVLVHLDQLTVLNVEVPGPASPEAAGQLHEALQALADQQPVPTDLALINDQLPDALDALVNEYHPALFVLGRPADDRADFDAGAVLLDVLRAARVPLLLVPETYPGPAAPQHLAVAADAEPFAVAAGGAAGRQLLQQLPPARVTVVTVTPAQADERCAEALEHVRRSGVLPATGPSPQVAGFYAQHPAAGLLQALPATGANWLLLLAREHGLLGALFHHSVISALLARSPVPVLVLPAAA